LTKTLVDVRTTARNLGLTDYDTRVLATCVSELGRNILKYAGSGEILIEEIGEDGKIGIQVTAHDRGPGIADLQAAMTDHYSSGGTLGLGLPGVKRMVDDFAIESNPGRGTKVVIRRWCEPASAARPGFHRAASTQALRRQVIGRSIAVDPPTEWSNRIEGAYCVHPSSGQRVSGDVVIFDWRRESLLIAVVDGLGHGIAAHQVALRARSYLCETWSTDIAATLSGLHANLQGTIGAVCGLCVINSETGMLTFAGVGNTMFRIFGVTESRLESVAGVLGQHIRTPKQQKLRFSPNDTLVAYTDGIKDRFECSQYPQLRYQNVRTVAEEIVNRFAKDHDDAACAVARYKG
jgi:anti-sigma regulatory factor (Ser/Thr protein kinase)